MISQAGGSAGLQDAIEQYLQEAGHIAVADAEKDKWKSTDMLHIVSHHPKTQQKKIGKAGAEKKTNEKLEAGPLQDTRENQAGPRKGTPRGSGHDHAAAAARQILAER